MSFLVAWWAVTLIACLDVRELSVPQVADRFSFLPSVGPCLAIALALLARLPARAPTALTVAVPALALLTVFWGFETVTDIPHWRDSLSLIQNGLARAPDNPSIHNVRGNYLRFLNHDLDGAEREYKMALSLDEKATVKSEQLKYDSYFGLGGVAQERGEDEQALAYYHRAAEIMPNVSPAFDALGAYYFPRHDYITASQYFARAVTANPMDVVAHIYMANCWMKLKKFGPAAEEFRAARMVDPSLKQAYWGEARALDAMGDHDGSAKVRAQYRE